MRLVFAAVLLSGLGCQGVQKHAPGYGPTGCAPTAHGSYADDKDGPGETGHKHGLCEHGKKDGHCLTCAKKDKKEPVQAQPPVGADQPVRQTAVTQDILLIPKTVYVPYAPHVPVHPARLGMSVPAGQQIPVNQPQQPVNAPPDTPVTATPPGVTETLEKCCQIMSRMDKRLCDLESQMAAPPAVVCPAPGPAVGPAPCHTPFLTRPRLFPFLCPSPGPTVPGQP